jgi:hypothetical protein
MSNSLFVLLPPSEGKSEGGVQGAAKGFFDESLREPRQIVLQALSTLLESKETVDWSKVLRVRGALLERALMATRALVDGTASVCPAWQRYAGVVWQHLEPATLSYEQRRHILVPSALYGLNRADDPIADYRLTFKSKLGDLQPLATLWRPALSEAMSMHCRERTLANLLPSEHAQVLDEEKIGEVARVVNAHFLSRDGERAIGHEAKAVKGTFARFILQNNLESVSDFRWCGWRATMKGNHIFLRAPKSLS